MTVPFHPAAALDELSMRPAIRVAALMECPSNPSIFEKAILGSPHEAVHAHVRRDGAQRWLRTVRAAIQHATRGAMR